LRGKSRISGFNWFAQGPQWGEGRMRVMLEGDAHFDGERVNWLDDRQTALLLLR
jgi:hypothetical protein